jgi:hypothetical protein
MNADGRPVSAPPLLDLLGASFVFNIAVQALAWDGTDACCGLANGTIAILRTSWSGAPGIVPRENGGIQIKAADIPPPPPHIIQAHRAPIVALAPAAMGGILTAGADGKLLRLVDGQISEIASHPRKAISHVAAGRGMACAMAAGRQVDIIGADARRVVIGAKIHALAFDPAGFNLAIGHEEGVTLVTAGVSRTRLYETTGMVGRPTWSADGTSLAWITKQGAIALVRPSQESSPTLLRTEESAAVMAFTADGHLVAVTGKTLLGWLAGRDQPPVKLTARPGAITNLASHPSQPIIAIGDESGEISLCQPGVPGRLVIRDQGSPILHLAYAPAGEALAFAAADHEAGFVALPDLLFRTGNRP